MRFAVLMLLLVVPPASAEDKPIPERWTLKLLPEKLSKLPDDLYGKSWRYSPPRSRTGRGYSDFLTFNKAAGDKPAEVVRRQVVYPRAGQPDRETTRTLPLRVEKSLLEFAGEVHTAAVHDGVLALKAAVPVGERTWYLVESDTFTNKKVRVSEYLFEFAGDPRMADSGKVTVKHASNLFPDPQPRQWEARATFTLGKSSKHYRILELRHEPGADRVTYNLPSLIVWPGRPHLGLNESNHSVIEYKLQK